MRQIEGKGPDLRGFRRHGRGRGWGGPGEQFVRTGGVVRPGRARATGFYVELIFRRRGAGD